MYFDYSYPLTKDLKPINHSAFMQLINQSIIFTYICIYYQEWSNSCPLAQHNFFTFNEEKLQYLQEEKAIFIF